MFSLSQLLSVTGLLVVSCSHPSMRMSPWMFKRKPMWSRLGSYTRTTLLIKATFVAGALLLLLSGRHGTLTSMRAAVADCEQAIISQQRELEQATKKEQDGMEAATRALEKPRHAEAVPKAAEAAGAPRLKAEQIQALSADLHSKPTGMSSGAHGNVAAAARASQINGRSLWHGSIQKSVEKAETLLQGAGVSRADRRRRIFIPVLTNHPNRLCNTIQLFHTNVVPYNNTADMFIFSLGNTAEATFKSQCGNRRVFSHVHFMTVAEHWVEPAGSARESKLWSYPFAGSGYRMMGQWRLLFPFTLGDALGYRYTWQIDDDSDFVQPVTTSLVAWMQHGNYKMAARKAYQDTVEVTWGLPELARTFLIAERYIPAGTLLKDHVSPPGWEGLFTLQNVSQDQQFISPQTGGWDRMVLNGNCMLLDLDAWFQPLVQRWIELVINSGYHYRFRWNEQSVIGMAWQLFVPKQQYAALPIPWNAYKHAGIYIPDESDCTKPYVYTIPCPARTNKTA